MNKCITLNNDILKGTYLAGSGFMKAKNTVFITCASLFASIGLLYNSTPVLLGSMLASPIGSPIMRGVIGISTKKYSILFQSIISLIILISIAYFTGIITAIANCKTNYFKYPTTEMLKRTEITNIYGDIMVALIAGILVTYGMYHKDLIVIVSVGLAISVLPPIVNSGLFHGIYLYYNGLNYNSNDENLEKGKISLKLGLINIVCVFITALITLKLIC